MSQDKSKYRKKPVVIEAVLWTGKNFEECSNFITDKNYRRIDRLTGKLRIKTLEGTMLADIGDYIIKGVKGEFYPCKPDIFEMTYEPADTQADCEGCKEKDKRLREGIDYDVPVKMSPKKTYKIMMVPIKRYQELITTAEQVLSAGEELPEKKNVLSVEELEEIIAEMERDGAGYYQVAAAIFKAVYGEGE